LRNYKNRLEVYLGVFTVFLLLNTGTLKAQADGFSPANKIYVPEGGIYTNAKVPLSIPKEGINYEDGVIPISNAKKQDINLEGLKVGTSSCINVLGLVQLGNGSIYQAAKSADIKKFIM